MCVRAFSTETVVEKQKDPWGLKFDEECLKFEQEWEKIADETYAR